MKRLTWLLMVLPVILPAQQATIKIDVERVIGEIDPKIYGVFMEPIGFNRGEVSGNTLYGTLYDPESIILKRRKNFRSPTCAGREVTMFQVITGRTG
jgi:alpha-N-arabinofuranosidase